MARETTTQVMIKTISNAHSVLLSGIREGFTAVKQAVQQNPVDSRVQDLYRSAAWRKFRKYWQENGILKENSDSPCMNYYQVTGSAREQYEHLTETLASHCMTLSGYGLPSDYKKILRGLMQSRLRNKYHEPCRMLSRMVPSNGTVKSSWSVVRLEKSTDLLLKLRKSEKISSRDLTKGLETIRKEIVSISVAGLVGSLFDSFASNREDNEEVLIRMINQIELNFKKFMNRFAKQPQDYPARYAEKMLVKYKKIKSEIRELKKNLSGLITMLEELEK